MRQNNNADRVSDGDRELLVAGYKYFIEDLENQVVSRFINKILVMKSCIAWGEMSFLKNAIEMKFPKGLEKKFDIHFLITNQYPYYGNYVNGVANFNFDGIIHKGLDMQELGEYFDISGNGIISLMLSGDNFKDFSYKQFNSLQVSLIAIMMKFKLSPYSIFSVHYFDKSKNNPGFSVRRKLINPLVNLIRDFKSEHKLGNGLCLDDDFIETVRKLSE